MSDSDRRAFLKQLAKTTAYSAPVIRTLAAPDPAMGQALSKKKGMGDVGGAGGMGKGKGKGGGWMKGWAMKMAALSDGFDSGSGFLREFGEDGFGKDER